MEAGQYCTFVLHVDGHISACGKGSYGRLGLGDSNNQMSPKSIGISGPVKNISSSTGSDGHTLALTEEGHVYSWGDGECGISHFREAFFREPFPGYRKRRQLILCEIYRGGIFDSACSGKSISADSFDFVRSKSGSEF